MSSCAVCHSTSPLQICTGCRGVFYCSKEHQKQNWKTHKPICLKLKEASTAGAIKEIIIPGDENAKPPEKGSKVSMRYIGTFPSGVEFDRSYDQPFQFTLGKGEVIKGWDFLVATMKPKEKAKFYISPAFGYGQRGVESIPPNMPLIFEVELLEESSNTETKTK